MTTRTRPCTNNATEKSAAIANAMRGLDGHEGMVDLYRRGCFRHIEDVSYALIMLDRHPGSIEEIAVDLDSSYEGPEAVLRHRCDRVYPPS